jgi:patatin-related protein
MLNGDEQEKEDLRLAVVLNGGVSLAVWIGGVTREINLLSSGKADFYRSLLQLMRSSARVDVITGTSAGGINGPALALAEVFGRDLSSLGELWITAGGFADLLRDPMEKNPQSLLKGDDYLLPQIANAYSQLGPDTRGPDTRGTETRRPMSLTVTGALWKAEHVPFVDDYGTEIVEDVHEVHFCFYRDDPAWGSAPARDSFADPEVVAQLALAARSTSANPFGFEASWVPVHDPIGGSSDPHPNMNGVAIVLGGMPLDTDRFVLDGGILINKPVRPALDAIADYPADDQVRRVMIYVQPDPGKVNTQNEPDTRTAPPTLAQVFMASGFSLPKAQTIAADLDEIRTHNTTARRGRDERSRRVHAFDSLDDATVNTLALSLLPAYRHLRARQLCDRISKLWLQRLPRNVGRLSAASPSVTMWTAEDLATVYDGNVPSGIDPFEDRFAFQAPQGSAPVATEDTAGDLRLDIDIDDWGLEPVDALASAVLDVSRRAMWLAPLDLPELRTRIRDLRRRVHLCRRELRALHQADDAFWSQRLTTLPDRPATLEARQTALASWLAAAGPRPWAVGAGANVTPDAAPSPGPPTAASVFQELTKLLVDFRADIDRSARDDPSHPWTVPGAADEAAALRRLYSGLNRQLEDTARFLAIQVCRAVIGGLPSDPGLEIALMQVSGYTPNAFGIPAVPAKLNGVQLSHFGAFYKQAWRANDWIWGRLDGSYRMVQVMLDPARLKQLGYDRAHLLSNLNDLATDTNVPGGKAYLAAQWEGEKSDISKELDFLEVVDRSAGADQPAVPATLPATTKAVARRIQLEILSEELPTLASSVVADQGAGSNKVDASSVFLDKYRFQQESNALDPANVVKLWKEAGIGGEHLMGELGSDLLATTASRAAAATVNALESTRSGVGPLRPVAKVLRGLTLVVYLLLTASIGGGFGAAVTNFALAVGGALVAVTVTVSGVPQILTLVGVTILLAGLVLAALRTSQKVFLLLFGVLLLLAALGLVLSFTLHWVKTNTANWWTLATVVGFALFAMLLGSVHSRPRSSKRATSAKNS